VLLALVAVVLVSGLVAYQRGEDTELLSLPAAERATLYERTFETLRSTCSHTRGEAFSDYCREQAKFLARFPECKGDCQQTCHQFRARPTK